MDVVGLGHFHVVRLKEDALMYLLQEITEFAMDHLKVYAAHVKGLMVE